MTSLGSNGNHNFETVLYKDIKVGDILKLKDGETAPVDCILLQTFDQNGQVYVETSALDGEINLKPLLAPRKINSNFEEIFRKSDSLKFEI